MAKARTEYVCRECGARAVRWSGRCPECQAWSTLEEKVVREEVQKAGFRLAAEATFLENPSDPRDWNASPRVAGEKRGTSDRFVLRFVRPLDR